MSERVTDERARELTGAPWTQVRDLAADLLSARAQVRELEGRIVDWMDACACQTPDELRRDLEGIVADEERAKSQVRELEQERDFWKDDSERAIRDRNLALDRAEECEPTVQRQRRALVRAGAMIRGLREELAEELSAQDASDAETLAKIESLASERDRLRARVADLRALLGRVMDAHERRSDLRHLVGELMVTLAPDAALAASPEPAPNSCRCATDPTIPHGEHACKAHRDLPGARAARSVRVGRKDSPEPAAGKAGGDDLCRCGYLRCEHGGVPESCGEFIPVQPDASPELAAGKELKP